MATWIVKPTHKKSILELNYWKKDNKTIVNEIGWRWGEFTIETETDEQPVIDTNTDLFSADFEVSDFSTNDGCWEENRFDGDWSNDEIEEMEDRLSDDISIYDLENEGWVCETSEMFITCEVEITKA